MEHEKHTAPDHPDETLPSSQPEPHQPFWKSRFGVSLIVALAIAALLLGFEHRVHIFAGNGFLVLLLLGCANFINLNSAQAFGLWRHAPVHAWRSRRTRRR